MVLALLLYAYAMGNRSSRGIERECVEDVAYRVIAANLKPDHSTIAEFRCGPRRCCGVVQRCARGVRSGRSAVYEQIPPLECQALHVLAATVPTARGAESDRVARHLLPLPPSRDLARVAVLRAAARAALGRGDAGATAHYLRRALEEPPSEEERGAVLYELGLAEATDRQRDCFDHHLREAMAETRDRCCRAQIGVALGRALASFGDFRASAEVLDDALRGLGDEDGELGVALEAELLTLCLHDFTSSELGVPHWKRRFSQLEAGEELDPLTLACLMTAIAVSRAGGRRDSPRRPRAERKPLGATEQRRRRPDRKRAHLRGRAFARGPLR